MDGVPQGHDIRLGPGALDRLMPMHLTLGPDGHITGLGPTLAKLLPDACLIGRDLFQVFEVRRPFKVTTMRHLSGCAGCRLYLAPCAAPALGLRGVAMPLAGGQGLILNLSFGIGVIEAIRAHALTDADFAPTDLTMEMLYLVEVNTAVTGELRDLNLRLQGAKIEAEEQALTDTLTGLRNRRALDLVLTGLTRQGVVFSLMHIDLDFFKAVNDTLGHAAGDHVLRAVGRVLTEETRGGDTVARVGGDEFVVVFPGFADPEKLQAIAARIIQRLSQPIDFEGMACRISASVGMTISQTYPLPDLDRMLSDADTALYASKRAGRGRATLFAAPTETP